MFRIWELVIVWDLEIGNWDLDFRSWVLLLFWRESVRSGSRIGSVGHDYAGLACASGWSYESLPFAG